MENGGDSPSTVRGRWYSSEVRSVPLRFDNKRVVGEAQNRFHIPFGPGTIRPVQGTVGYHEVWTRYVLGKGPRV